MVKMKSSLLLYFICACTCVFGQIQSIGPFQLLSDPDNQNDSIKLEVTVNYYSAPGNLVDYVVNVDESKNIIEIQSCYFSGPLTTFDISIDTLDLGILFDDEYKLKYIAGEGLPVNDLCQNMYLVDTLNLTLIVSHELILNNRNPDLISNISIHNIVNSNILGVENNTFEKLIVKIYTISGMEINKANVDVKSYKQITIPNINAGLYAVVITGDDHKILKSELVLK